jgi:hypothetical protein
MFSLYFNFDDDKCLASNYREDGENFQDVKTQSCKLLGDSNAEPPELPELQRVPFYDFHFQPVDCLRCVRERWRLLSGLTEAELCQTVK